MSRRSINQPRCLRVGELKCPNPAGASDSTRVANHPVHCGDGAADAWPGFLAACTARRRRLRWRQPWKQRQSQPPAPLDRLWGQTPETLAYLPVQLSGVFLRDQYFLLDNRIYGGTFGYEVLGIMRLLIRVAGAGESRLDCRRSGATGDACCAAGRRQVELVAMFMSRRVSPTCWQSNSWTETGRSYFRRWKWRK